MDAIYAVHPRLEAKTIRIFARNKESTPCFKEIFYGELRTIVKLARFTTSE